MIQPISIHDLTAFHLGNAENTEAGTGCTVILVPPEGAVPGVDVRGGAPGTRETDLLRSEEMMPIIHALVLSGGSAFGLDAAGGVMAHLEEAGIGFDTGVAKVPIVPAAVLFDLAYGDPQVRPDAAMGRTAAKNALLRNYQDGSFGAGAGATVGKILGPQAAMKSGIGSYALDINGLKIGAVVAVNALGSIYEEGKLLAGPLLSGVPQSTEELMMTGLSAGFPGNTTIGCILTNARLDKSQANKIASMGHDGFARAIRPVHTQADGDTLFVLGSGEEKADVNILGTLGALVVERAIHRALHAVSDDPRLPTVNTLNLR